MGDLLLATIFFGFYLFCVYLILFQIELRIKIIARIKCKLGFHKKRVRKNGRWVRKYRCEFCKKSNADHLTLIQGDKKELKSKFTL